PAGWADLTIEAQLEDPASTLSLYRRALELRREHPAISGASVGRVGAPAHSPAFPPPGGPGCALKARETPGPLPPRPVRLSSGSDDGGQLPPDTAGWLAPLPDADQPSTS